MIVAVVLHAQWWEDPIFVDVLPLFECNKFQAFVVSINKDFPHNHIVNMLNVFIAILNNFIKAE